MAARLQIAHVAVPWSFYLPPLSLFVEDSMLSLREAQGAFGLWMTFLVFLSFIFRYESQDNFWGEAIKNAFSVSSGIAIIVASLFWCFSRMT